MVNKTKALERERTRRIKSQNSGQVDLRRMRRLRKVRTKFWTSKKRTAVLGEKVPSEQPKAEKKEKKKKEPELEVIEKKPETDEVDELDELYTYDEEIEEESTETKENPEIEDVDEVPLETEENSET